jgi:hypothetical protein
LTAAATLAQPSRRARRFGAMENQVDLLRRRNRRHAAVLIRTDGRRVQLPADDVGLVDVSLFGVARFIGIGIERVLVLISGSRRETGRRDQA